MTKQISLATLWDSTKPTDRPFHPNKIAHLPAAAQHYLNHAIAPQTQLATAVRLQMHGEIKLKKWLPFTAEQVICWEHGLIWSATAWMNGLPIVGSDRVLDGVGAMQWKLLGLFPVMIASGPDITRSALGRLQIESVWLPSVYCAEGVSWSTQESLPAQPSEESRVQASFYVQGERANLALNIDRTGRLKTMQLPRWGNPDGGAFREVNFGAIVEEEATFSGYTIPSRLRVGWYFGSDRFDSEGEFFRATIDEAIYR